MKKPRTQVNMKLSESLWRAVDPIYQQILQHSFITELAEGTLEEKRFIFYMKQDSYYLISFSRALAFVAGRAMSPKHIDQLLNFAVGALVAERELHGSFLPLKDHCDSIDPSPACLSYTQYLIATAATAPVEEAIAAILPCFWIYREVGCYVSKYCAPKNPYKRWIDTYSSQEFFDVTVQAIDLLDEHASNCSMELLERMKKAFEYSSLFEWHFWNDAYQMIRFRDSATPFNGSEDSY